MRLVCLLLLLAPLTSHAVDGVLEINQACINGGCFPGDDPGLPILIANPGSYRLTSNIDISSYPSPESLTAILINANNVSLDLNGFAISGTTVCAVGPAPQSPVTSCSPTGSGNGVEVYSSSRTSISNGFVKGMGHYGVYCGAGCRISDMVVSENGLDGIGGVHQGLIVDSHSYRNGNGGFLAVGSVLIGNSAVGNKAYGIQSYNGRLDNNIITSNGAMGVDCQGCSVSNSMIRKNESYGIVFGAGSTYGGNTLQENTLGSVSGSALQTAPNWCATEACP
jgi:hypothetical protein